MEEERFNRKGLIKTVLRIRGKVQVNDHILDEILLAAKLVDEKGVNIRLSQMMEAKTPKPNN